MSERKLRFISEEPRIALFLRKIRIGILPENIREWALSWIEDVGRTMRMRENMVGFTASMIYYGLLITVLDILGLEAGKRLLGIR